MNDAIGNLELEKIRAEVERYFQVYEYKLDREGMVFFCKRESEEDIDYRFDLLRDSLSRYDFLPLLRKEGGEYLLFIFPAKIRRKGIPTSVNLILLIATIITTTLTGSLLVSGKISLLEGGAIEEVLKPENLINGFMLFSLPLLTILGIHEMAHYYTSMRHNVRASLPFFIPVPPVLGFNIGTFGALISSKDPIHNRKALFDIGFSGPIAGFVVAIPITIYGIMQSQVVSIESVKGEISLGSFILFDILAKVLKGISANETLLLHPTAFAGWVGLLVTAVNLFPVGQLDGGHVARAVLGEKQRQFGWISTIILLFTGWFAFALLVALLFGVQHPPPLNDVSKVDAKRKALFVVAMIILILCFPPFPIYPSG